MVSTGSGFVGRPVRFLGVASLGKWRVKRFGISAVTDGPRPAVIEAADAATVTALQAAQMSSVSGTDQSAWVAFTIVHEARPACFLQINQWCSGVDLVQRYLTSPLDQPHRWVPVTTGAIGCVWELPVIAHECDAWVQHVLDHPGEPDLEAYLTARPGPRHTEIDM